MTRQEVVTVVEQCLKNLKITGLNRSADKDAVSVSEFLEAVRDLC